MKIALLADGSLVGLRLLAFIVLYLLVEDGFTRPPLFRAVARYFAGLDGTKNFAAHFTSYAFAKQCRLRLARKLPASRSKLQRNADFEFPLR